MVDFTEILFIAVVALLLFGPDKLPQYLRELGKFYAEIRKAQREFEREINKNMAPDIPAKKAPSDKVTGIAKKMGIPVEGKSEEQILSEIELALSKVSPGEKT